MKGVKWEALMQTGCSGAGISTEGFYVCVRGRANGTGCGGGEEGSEEGDAEVIGNALRWTEGGAQRIHSEKLFTVDDRRVETGVKIEE